jgi:hypothetical protein
MAEKRIPQTINNNNTTTAEGRSNNISVTRVECMIQNYTLPSTYKHVLVLGKHCCGTGTDAGIEFVKTYSSQIQGAVFATCCCCKIAHGFGVRSIENVIPTTKKDNSNSNESCDINNDDEDDDQDDDDNNAHENNEELNGVPVEAGLGNSSIQFFDSLYFSSTTTTTTTMMCQMTGMEDTTNNENMDSTVSTTSINIATTDSVIRDSKGLLIPQEHDDDDDDNNVSNVSNSNCSTPPKYNLDNYTGLSGASAKRLANAANNNNNGKKLNNESEIELYRRVLPEVARATSWRNQLHNVQDRKYKYDAVSCFYELIEQAEYFESWIQGFRRRRLVQLFGWVEEVLYCSDDVQHSQQNRCLVSGRQRRRRQQLCQSDVVANDNGSISDDEATISAGMMTTETTPTTETTTDHEAFFMLLEERFVQLKDILPIDLRPYGVISRKYEYYPIA